MAIMRLLLLLLLGSFSASAKTKSWTLYHRILTPGGTRSSSAEESWDERGTIELVVDPEEEVVVTVVNKEGALTSDLAQALTATATATAYYQLKLVENSSKTSANVLTSVPACHVRRANFRDEFVLQLQPGTAKALSLSYMPLISPLAPPTCDAYHQSLPETLAFDSKVTWETAIPGMKVGAPVVTADPTKPQAAGHVKPPPGLQWIPGAPRKTSSPQGGVFAEETPAPETGITGFFKRYWYILLPIMLINLFGGAAAPPAAEEGAAAAVGAAGAAAASTGGGGAGSPVRQRRGKRD